MAGQRLNDYRRILNNEWTRDHLNAAQEAAETALLWQTVRAGNHEEQPAPTLRQILFPPVYEPPTTLSPNNELNRILIEVVDEVENAGMARELPNNLTPPLPTPP